MTSDIEEAAYREAAERKAQAKASKAEARAKKKALTAAKRANRSAERQRAIDAARNTGYTGRVVLLNEDSVVDRANREAATADAERKRLKEEARAKKKATKKAERSSKKLQKQMAMDAIRQTGWSRPVVMFNQQKLFNERPAYHIDRERELYDLDQEYVYGSKPIFVKLGSKKVGVPNDSGFGGPSTFRYHGTIGKNSIFIVIQITDRGTFYGEIQVNDGEVAAMGRTEQDHMTDVITDLENMYPQLLDYLNGRR